ncbi:uncharacterized protein CLUP02_15164 [Colletotrichum lupini]|uniref:Uncharacterized protein n=1 Tax=Colletotrichum lupini TaxID=145971 RepID=A0A9Q8WN12_9PEZI|nr:uncharacterized protein CLUP02_15164 [Colletotrichum lupini]UQC89633.1 hypothetical protein CLUP02_15164 [Colletotrichum lupini]
MSPAAEPAIENDRNGFRQGFTASAARRSMSSWRPKKSGRKMLGQNPATWCGKDSFEISLDEFDGSQ